MKYILFFLAISTLLLTGCKKDQINQIIGRWSLYQIPANLESDYVWSFEEDDIVHNIRMNLTSGAMDTVTTANYLLKNGTLTIAGPTPIAYFLGDFRIQKLDNEFLVLLTQDGGQEYYEFVKEN
jgi:hypothetical protein